MDGCWSLYGHKKNSVNASVGGLGMIIGPRTLKTLNSIERIQPRMMVATFNGNPKATIISCYSPTNVSDETELVTFYEELSSLVCSIPKHNLQVIGGDMNAQIGKNRNNKYSLHNTSNRNGQHLIDFMIENRLTCLNTNFQKREGKLWTYTYANNSKVQIDFINRKWKNSEMNCEAYSSFEGVSSNHRIVTTKVRVSLRNIYIYIILTIFIYSHLHTNSLVVSQLFSVARLVGRLKLRSKPARLYVRLSIIPLN